MSWPLYELAIVWADPCMGWSFCELALVWADPFVSWSLCELALVWNILVWADSCLCWPLYEVILSCPFYVLALVLAINLRSLYELPTVGADLGINWSLYKLILLWAGPCMSWSLVINTFPQRTCWKTNIVFISEAGTYIGIVIVICEMQGSQQFSSELCLLSFYPNPGH